MLGLFNPASRAFPWGRSFGLADPPDPLVLVASGITLPIGGLEALTFRLKFAGSSFLRFANSEVGILLLFVLVRTSCGTENAFKQEILRNATNNQTAILTGEYGDAIVDRREEDGVDVRLDTSCARCWFWFQGRIGKSTDS